MIRDDRAAALGDNRRMLHARVVAHGLDVVDDVVGVFLEGVVDAGLEVRLRPVVVHAQPAADVEILEPGAVLDELGVHARRLVQRTLDDADVRDLAAQVEVQQLEAVLHAVRLELFEPLAHLGHRQAELRAIAARRLPSPAAARGQLHAHADVRPHAHLAGVLQDQTQLGVLFDHWDDASAHLLGQHRHLDELGVLEAVADDRRVVRRHRDDGQQLRLGAGLEPEVVGPSEVEHFLHHLPLLVDLDRVDAEVAAVVLVLRNRGLERRVDVRKPLPQDVAKPDEDRKADPAQLQVIDELLQIDRPLGIARRVDAQMPARRDRKIALPPAVDLVQLGRIADRPGIALAPRSRDTSRRAHAANNTGSSS